MKRAPPFSAIPGWRVTLAWPRLPALAALLGLWLCAAVQAADLDDAREMAGRGQVQEALATVNKVLVSRPDDVEASLLRGVLLSRLGDSDTAIAVFNDIATARPELPEPHNNLAVLYAAQGRYEEAREALLQAVRLQPDYDLAHENLGDVYAKLASLSYARARQVNPSNEAAARKFAAAERLLAGEDADVSVRRVPPAVRQPAAGPGASATAVSATCVTIPDIRSGARSERVARWLGERGMVVRVEQASPPGGGARDYRVYLPSLGSRDAARRRVAELRAAGIQDVMIINDARQRNGISLGVFGRREGAERRVNDLASRGITAQIAARGEPEMNPTTVIARGTFSPAAFARTFPDLPFSTEDCQ